MKRILFTAISALVLFVSCQKEIDWGTGGGTTVTSQKLVMIKSKTGTDTTQIVYTYDASGRLIRERTTGMSNGADLDNDLLINRNSSGIITTSVQKAAALVLAGIDSVITKYYYNTGTSKYTASSVATTLFGISIVDSALYTYDASGKITKDEHYLLTLGLPIPLPPVLIARNTYTYSSDGKNLIGMNTDAAIPPATTLSPATAQTYTLDTKVSPLILQNEAILLLRPASFSASNPTKSGVSNTVNPTLDFAIDFTYKYNSSNKPDSSYGTRTPGGAVTATKYYYQ